MIGRCPRLWGWRFLSGRSWIRKQGETKVTIGGQVWVIRLPLKGQGSDK